LMHDLYAIVGMMGTFFVPAVLLAICANLENMLPDHMDPVVQHVLIQNKYLATTMCSFVVFRNRPDYLQIEALFLLLGGSILAALEPEKTFTFKSSQWGLLLIVLYVFSSASAQVYTEWTHKSNKHNHQLVNIAMCFLGIAINWIRYIQVTENFVPDMAGFNLYSYLDILNKASLGIIVGWVSHHITRSHRIFMFGFAILVTAFLAHQLNMPFELGLQNGLGMCIILMSIGVYHHRELPSLRQWSNARGFGGTRHASPTKARSGSSSPKKMKSSPNKKNMKKRN